MQKPTKLFPAQHSVVVYFHSPEFGVSFDDMLKPEYWSHVAQQLRPGYRIEVMAPDGAWWGMLIVRAASRTEAMVAPLQKVDLEGKGAKSEAKVSEPDFEIKWRGPARKFGVIRKSDGEVIKDEFQIREHAEKWLATYTRNLEAA